MLHLIIITFVEIQTADCFKHSLAPPEGKNGELDMHPRVSCHYIVLRHEEVEMSLTVVSYLYFLSFE